MFWIATKKFRTWEKNHIGHFTFIPIEKLASINTAGRSGDLSGPLKRAFFNSIFVIKIQVFFTFSYYNNLNVSTYKHKWEPPPPAPPIQLKGFDLSGVCSEARKFPETRMWCSMRLPHISESISAIFFPKYVKRQTIYMLKKTNIVKYIFILFLFSTFV